ncbi:MAG: hypothetical protein JO125_08795, partial [Chloroflexi bacterium]|nr:hypothetical protein [Chloroflexota bacterium]
MQDAILNPSQSGPIHLPKDGRAVDVQVNNLVKTFGKFEAVKGVSFRRLLIAPIQKYALLAGKLVAQFILTLAQLAFFFIVGYF